MNLKRTIYLVVFLMGFAFQQAHSQSYTPITGVINEYASVTAILSAEQGNLDSVVVDNYDAFLVDDTVMLYCVKGATIGTADPDSTYPGGHSGYDPGWDALTGWNAGKYAFLRVSEKVGPNIIVFNTEINSGGIGEGIRPMAAGDVAQLIKVRSYRYANVTGTGLEADPWDPVTGKGGVVTLFVHGVLRLDADIDVSGDGFIGAPGSTDDLYTFGCSSSDTLLFYENFYLNGNLRAGLKGEGSTDATFLYNRGKASNINGGGGGNGLHSGGGGGSNWSAGVRGGGESSFCTPGVAETGGAGGFDLGRNGHYYINETTSAVRTDRVFFGGGGGSGTQTVINTSTDGANGGGIVVIIADTIVGNGGRILADGASVSGLALNGAAGGGGGGGCIVLDVAGYQNTLNLSAIGGNGGNTSGTYITGMGGAGGGGIYWLAGASQPGVSLNPLRGTNGTYIDTGYDPLESPNSAGSQDDLIAPLKGFLFNPVPFEYTVCSDQDPEPIITSDPKGGDAPYTYQWIDSSATQNFWAIVPGATSKDYDPGLLSDTVYYKRILTDASSLVDTSFRIAVYVHPEITGNAIAANDTVCYDNAPNLFVSAATIGGGPTGGTFTYVWQHMPDGSGSYSDITAALEEPTYQAPDLITSTDYRRIAHAGVCIDTSNQQRVRVFETLTGNDITPFDTICINTVPDLINGPAPSNGDQGDLRYQWLTSTDPGLMGTVIPAATAISYQSPALSQTTYIRRIVLSGNDDACRDTSAFVEILNISAITNNNITSSDQTLCQEDQASLLTGSSPGGGDLVQYIYTWEESTNQSSWVPASGASLNNEINFDPGVMSGDTTWYRRIVGSGGLELVCKDTSSFIVIEVIPSIANNLVSPADLIQCQQEFPEALTGSLPVGGATVAGNDPTRVYRWELAQIEGIPGSGNWTHPSTGADAQDYTDPNQLTTDVDRWYKRIVISGSAGECTDTSNLVRLVVHSEITANAIDAAQAICFNEAIPPALRNIALTGGEDTIVPVYTWRRWLEGENSADGVDIAGSDEQEFVSGPYTDPATLIYNYDRMVEIGACRDTSNEMLVTVMQLPGGVLTDADFPACEKDTVLELDLNMAALTLDHFVTPWEVYLKDGVHTGIGPGSVDLDLDNMAIVMDTDGADFVSYTYEIESIRYYPEGSAYACISSAAELPLSPVVVDLSRRPDPVILADGEARDSFKVCNTTATLVMNPDNGTLSYWSSPTGSVFFSPGAGPNEYNVTIPNNPDDFGEYRIFARSEAGDCAGQDFIDLHFFEQPANANAGESTMLFLNDKVQLTADPATAGLGTWHQTGGSGEIEDKNDPNTFVYNLELGENTFRWTVTNGEDEGVCSTSEDVTIVRRNEVKRYNGFSPNGDMNNEYYIMQGLVYADEFSVSFLNSLGTTVRTINQDNIDELDFDPSLISDGLKEDEMVIWDGKAENGNLVASGTYYFVVTLTMYERNYETGAITDAYSDSFKDYVVVVRE